VTEEENAERLRGCMAKTKKALPIKLASLQTQRANR
jgi:hypothetical protein